MNPDFQLKYTGVIPPEKEKNTSIQISALHLRFAKKIFIFGFLLKDGYENKDPGSLDVKRFAMT